MTNPAEKWKAKAREVFRKLGAWTDFDYDPGRDIDTLAAALAEAYEAGRNSRARPPKGESGPPVDAATSWNLHYD